MAELLKY